MPSDLDPSLDVEAGTTGAVMAHHRPTLQPSTNLPRRSFPDAFYDPTTGKIMAEPVVNPAGDSYEKSALLTDGWIHHFLSQPGTAVHCSARGRPGGAILDGHVAACRRGVEVRVFVGVAMQLNNTNTDRYPFCSDGNRTSQSESNN